MGSRKPFWRDREWLPRPAPGSGRYRRWLVERGSLTSRIAARCARFRVELLYQGRGRATRDERFIAGARARGAFVREVYLYCGRTPLLFAHSVVRARDLRGAWRRLLRLGARPLAQALFADPRIVRRSLRFRRLAAREALYARAASALEHRPPQLWARRSVFTLGESPILVTEVFLPGILRL